MVNRIAMIALLMLVLVGALLQNIYLNNATDRLVDHLEEVKTALEEDNASAAVDAVNTFCSIWDKEKSIYEMLFEHNEVDIISATVSSMRSYCISGDQANALANNAAAAYYIEHILQMDNLHCHNIF